MRPQTLSEAIQLVIQEYNVKYFQKQTPNFTQQPPKKLNQQTHFTNQNFCRNPQTSHHNNFKTPFFNSQTNNYQFRPSFPSQPIPIRPNANFRPQKFFTNSEVFGQNKSQIKNVFKSEPHKPLPKPTPMSVSTRNTFRPNLTPGPSYQQQQPSQQNFIVEELYNTQTDTDANYKNNSDYETQYFDGNHDLPYNNYYTYNQCDEYSQEYTQPVNNNNYVSEHTEESQNFQEPQVETKET